MIRRGVATEMAAFTPTVGPEGAWESLIGV